MSTTSTSFSTEDEGTERETAGSNEADPSLMPQSAITEVLIGQMIGSGSFSNVYKAMVSFENGKVLKLPFGSSRTTELASVSSSSSDEWDANDDIEGESVYYAIKMLNDKTLACPEATSLATVDLFYEAKILSKLPRHQHIVKLYAVSPNFWEVTQSGYLVLELLSETLHDRLSRLRSSRVSPKMITLSLERKRTMEQQQLGRVCDLGLPIAKALAFLHHHNICYRDLKPHNIGFDKAGILKLFDLGLAREYRESEDGGHMTRLAGTARYMAPEVMRYGPYGPPADVYSFSVLLWEIGTLQRPFSRVRSLQAAQRLILRSHGRPPLKGVCNRSVRDLLAAGWKHDAELRPSFANIVHQLEQICF